MRRAVAVGLLPPARARCPVCFGQSDSPMAWAMNTGILVMLVVVGGVLAGFAGFFVHLVRRARSSPRSRGRPKPNTQGWEERRNAELSRAAGCGSVARRRYRSDDGPGALADAGAVRRLGRVLPVRAGPVPARRQPEGRTTPARTARSRRRPKSPSPSSKWSLLVFYAIPAWATRVKDLPAENEATVVRVVGEQFAWNVHYPGADGKFGRTDIKLVSSDNPLGLDRSDPDAKDDITDHQPAEPAGQSAGAGPTVEQGRHPQLRTVRDAGEAGRAFRACRFRSGSFPP